MKTKLLAVALAAMTSVTPARTRADVVTDWNGHLERAMKTEALNPGVQGRFAAIVHGAIYDAVNGLVQQYEPYFVRESGPTGARPDAAAVQAAYAALARLFPTQTVTFDAALATSLAALPEAVAQSNAIAQGRAWGESVAHRILDWRGTDGFADAIPGYFGGTNVGVWRSVPTPSASDGTLPAVFPQMAVLVPFAMNSPSQFRPGPPYGLPLAAALASAAYAADVNEVKAIGRFDSATRTAEQTSLARLWQATGAAEENNCVRQIVPAGQSLVDNARLFALVNIVAADTIIAGFDSKYTYNFWRPHHAIRFADLDGNPDTTPDAEWAALFVAPRHQEYISNHAVFTGGFMHALRRLLGDDHTFTLGSQDFPGFTWTFHHVSEVAAQAKEARIWAGIHYRNSCNVGEAVGLQIADYVLDNFLRPATALAITQPPQDQSSTNGSTVTFAVTATGTPPLRYQWLLNTNSTARGAIPGATNATLTFVDPPVTTHRFSVAVTDGFGHSVTSVLAQLKTYLSPILTNPPSRQSAVAGETATLHVVAGGTLPLAYQWYFNSQPLANRTASDLAFASVQPADAGDYHVVVTNPYGAATSQVATVRVVAPTLFVRVTNGVVATTTRQGTGAVWADFNNDGLLDLYTLDFESGTNHYFQNTGNGNFTRIGQDASLYTGLGSVGTSAVDYDNDGYLDLVVTANGPGAAVGTNSLFHNNGDGTFTRVTAGGLGTTIGYLVAADWADYDSDGFADVLVSDGTFGDGTARNNQLWHNNGDGTFSRITGGPIATDRGFASGALWFDYDTDGKPDLLTLNRVSSGGATNYLYHNEGNGVFTRNLTSPIGTDRLSGGSEGADWGDYDNDGLMDLFVADNGGARSHLYHNDSSGSFADVPMGPMLAPPAGSNPRGATWGDYDNDGYLDLVMFYTFQSALYRNNRDGTFTEIRHAGLAADTLSAPYGFNSVSWADYDNDGFLDLYLCVGYTPGQPVPRRPSYLYHNWGNSNGWLEVKCVGTVANRSALGARIRVKATIDGLTFWQVRELKSSAGWDVATPLVAHFGLGGATNVETLRIEWPSGTLQELHNVIPRQILTVTEPPRLTATEVSGRPEFILKGGRNMHYDIEGSADLRTWSLVDDVTITNMNGTVQITDLAPAAGHKFYRARQ